MKVSTRPVSRIHCPIEPEILLADIQNELAIEEQREVQRHFQTCEQCRARSEQLREVYEQVAGLSDVADVPSADVRDTVLRDSQGHLRAVRLTRGLNLSVRGSVLAVIGAIAALIILIVLIARPFLQNHLLSVQRSQNSLSKLAPVGSGFYYAETVKLIPVTVSGTEWDLGEVIVLDEHTGQVVRSLPASNLTPFVPDLGIGAGTNIRPALSADGKTIIEAAIPSDGHSATAFAAIDAVSGKLRYITHMTPPAGVTAQADPTIRQFWISPDNATVLVLADLVVNNVRSPHLLRYSLDKGKLLDGIVPPLDSTASLSGTTSALSPKGDMFYDATLVKDAQGHLGEQIIFVGLTTRKIEASIFIPGESQLTAMTLSPDGSQIFLFNGKTATISFISVASRSVVATVQLSGKPSTDSGTATGDASLAITPDGSKLVAVADRIVNDVRTYNLWIVSVDQQTFLTLVQDPHSAFGAVDTTSDGSTALILRPDGTVQTLTTTTPKHPQPWVQLADKTAIIQLIKAYQPAAK